MPKLGGTGKHRTDKSLPIALMPQGKRKKKKAKAKR